MYIYTNTCTHYTNACTHYTNAYFTEQRTPSTHTTHHQPPKTHLPQCGHPQCHPRPHTALPTHRHILHPHPARLPHNHVFYSIVYIHNDRGGEVAQVGRGVCGYCVPYIFCFHTKHVYIIFNKFVWGVGCVCVGCVCVLSLYDCMCVCVLGSDEEGVRFAGCVGVVVLWLCCGCVVVV